MTKSLPFTELAIKRAIAGTRKTGLHVRGVTIAPDGSITVLAGESPAGDISLVPDARQDADVSRWRDE